MSLEWVLLLQPLSQNILHTISISHKHLRFIFCQLIFESVLQHYFSLMKKHNSHLDHNSHLEIFLW